MQFPATQALSLVQNVLVLVAGTLLVIGGETNVGTVLAFAGYSALLAAPLAEMADLDEATSNVDTRTEMLIQDGMRALMEGKTSFSIAHRLATIRGSSRIMVLDGDEIEEMASHDDLMAAKGFYCALCMSQFKGKGPGGDAEEIALDFVST